MGAGVRHATGGKVEAAGNMADGLQAQIGKRLRAVYHQMAKHRIGLDVECGAVGQLHADATVPLSHMVGQSTRPQGPRGYMVFMLCWRARRLREEVRGRWPP